MDALVGDLWHLALAPRDGVGEHDAELTESKRGEFAPGGADHRFEVPEVR